MIEKTCGTCGAFNREKGKCDDFVEEDGSPVIVAQDSPACEEWFHPSELLEPEDKLAKLEQVAREMLTYLASIKANPSPLKLTQDTQKFRDQLTELGVSVDD